MKKLLVVDQWYGVQGGASKSALYSELAKCFDITFVRAQLPKTYHWMNLLKTFHPDIDRWKKRKAYVEENAGKTPEMFTYMTQLFNKEIRKVTSSYDAILQIGSLFGPVENKKNVPYFSYSDSTVRNPDTMWKQWMPQDFDRYKDRWYALESKYFRSMTEVMVYSQFVKDTLIDFYKVDEHKVNVVGSALKVPQEYDIDWSHRDKNVLFVSTDFRRKGGQKLIKIFEGVVSQVPEATLTLVGWVPEGEIQENKPWLRNLGSISKDELIKQYKKASVLLHPAQYDPFPSVILEAANFEMPAVASHICGIPQMIVDGTSGYLVEKDDVSGFQKRLVELLQDKDKQKSFGLAAKEYVRTKYHPKVVAENIARIINRSLE